MDNSVIEVRDKDRKRFRVNYLVLGSLFGVKDHKVVVERKYSFF